MTPAPLNAAAFMDVTRLLTPHHPNWPGDAPLRVDAGARIAAGDSVNTGVLSTSTHTGTHVDAPWHYDDGGVTLEAVPLDVYVGRCRVLSVPGSGAVTVDAGALAALPAALPPRLLLNTGQPAHWTEFPREFAVPTPAFVREAARRGVRLLGTDAPSVDPLDSKTLDTHHACRQAGMFLLEGLNLTAVPDGEYELICLPLPLVGVDGAPARVILRPL